MLSLLRELEEAKRYYGLLYFGQNWWIKVKIPWWWMFFFLQLFISQDVNWWIKVCVDYFWIILLFFISCLDSHFDGTHSHQRIHWWQSNATFLQICSCEEPIHASRMAWGWVNFFFYWNVVYNQHHICSGAGTCENNTITFTFESTFIHFGGKCLLLSNPDEKAYMSEVTSLAAPNLSPEMDHTLTYAVITCYHDTLVTQ